LRYDEGCADHRLFLPIAVGIDGPLDAGRRRNHIAGVRYPRFSRGRSTDDNETART
jgi:hypothetical protein